MASSSGDRYGADGPGADELRDLLATTAGQERLKWLEEAVESVLHDRSVLATMFPAVGRKVGRQRLGQDQVTVHDWTVDDAGRVLLLLAAGEDACDEIHDLYRFGDAAERRAILRALPFLPGCDRIAAFVEDALRTNDPRLIAAAVSRYALDQLDDDAFNQAILKCVFVGVPLPDVTEQATPELARMLAGYVHERVAAGRDVPADVWPLIEAHAPLDLLDAIEAELDHPVRNRREAAAAALTQRTHSRTRS